jgi:4-hydroxybenzoate polyprenyltransferase
MAQLRFMDEYKDYEKDKIAHPERPLPRGLITINEVKTIIIVLQCLLFALAFFSVKFFNTFSGIYLIIGITWLFLMYKEFYIGKSLGKFPFIYAISHQIIIIPLGIFAISAINKYDHFEIVTVWLSLLLLSTFFIYEISRKLDPHALPILGTYLIISGKYKTTVAISILTMLGLFVGYQLNLGFWIYIPLILTYLSHVIIFIRPAKYKITEAFVTLYLLFVIWLIPIKNFFK